MCERREDYVSCKACSLVEAQLSQLSNYRRTLSPLARRGARDSLKGRTLNWYTCPRKATLKKHLCYRAIGTWTYVSHRSVDSLVTARHEQNLRTSTYKKGRTFRNKFSPLKSRMDLFRDFWFSGVSWALQFGAWSG